MEPRHIKHGIFLGEGDTKGVIKNHSISLNTMGLSPKVEVLVWWKGQIWRQSGGVIFVNTKSCLGYWCVNKTKIFYPY